MKTIRIFLLICILTSALFASSQNSILPAADLYTLEGKKVSTSDISDSNSLTVVIFWNMNDPKSLEQLIAVNEANEDLLNGKKVKFIGVCTDVNGYMQSVKPFIYGNAIGMDIYIDKNNELKRLMSVPTTPYTILFDQERNRETIAMGNSANITVWIGNVLNDHLAEGK